MVKGGRKWIGAAILAIASFGPAAAETYTFGVLSQRSAVLTAQYWNPILDYVGRRAGIELDLRPARTALESNAAIAAGEYDFVYSNTIFLPALTGADYRVILRPRGDAIAGQIVVPASSPIRDLRGLEGRSVGFPSQAAFVGYALPMDHLLRRGITVQPEFGGNQEGIMAQLKAGKVAAAGVNSQVMRAYAAREGMAYRVLWESKAYHNIPVAVHPRVPAATVEKVRRVLADMADDSEGLRLLDQGGRLLGQSPPYGFVPAVPADYADYADFYRQTLVKDIR